MLNQAETIKGDPARPAPVVVNSLLSIAKSTRAFIALLLAEIGLHPGQDQLLDRLDPEQPVSVSVLAEDLAVRPSTISKMLDRLIEKGLVTRLASDSDARRTLVQLTEEGVRAQEQVRAIWQRLETELTSAMDRETLQTLDHTLTSTGDLLARKLRRLR